MNWQLPVGKASPVVFCAGPDPDFNPDSILVPALDASHIGPVLTILRARLDDEHLLEETVWNTYSDDEIIQSGVELAILSAASVVAPQLEFAEQSPEEFRNAVTHAFGIAAHHMTVSFLLNTAQQVEHAAMQHAGGCASCRSLVEESPLIIRGRLYRDLADAIATDFGDHLHINGLPAVAVVDACWFLLQLTEQRKDISIDEQLTDFVESLVEVVATLGQLEAQSDTDGDGDD